MYKALFLLHAFFPLNHLKFPSAGQKLYIVPLPKHAGSLSCGFFRYRSAQVSVLSFCWISSGCSQSSRSGLYQGLCCPSLHSSSSLSAARKGHLGQLKMRQTLVSFGSGGKKNCVSCPSTMTHHSSSVKAPQPTLYPCRVYL